MSKAYYKSTGYRPRKRKYHRSKCQEERNDKNTSASAKKLKLDNFSVPEVDFIGYRIIDIALLFGELQKHLCCNSCFSPVTISESDVCGLGSTFSITCSKCEKTNDVKTSKKIGIQKNMYEVNLRAIYAARCIGHGLSGLRTFCSIMDFPPPLTQKSYESAIKKIKEASSKVAKASMNEAAEEETKLTHSSDICVSGDGTWKTRGHTSKIGVCTVIGAESGKVVDAEVLSSFCKGCKGKNLKHDCKQNHSGTAGKMEVVGMSRIFLRSELLRSVRYLKYIGDGDAKTFQEICKIKPYDKEVTKEECIGHVQKRVGTRLRKLKTELKGKKLSDGKPLSGKGRLTDKLIDQLTVYYGNAIRSNTGSLENMRKAIWAVWAHTSSSDEEPMHYFCPPGESSWCKYQKHQARKKADPFVHKPLIPKAVSDAIKKVFSELSNPKLLKRCLGGKTQNPNESFNALIWKFCPKTSGSGKDIVDIAVNEAVITFNKGRLGRTDVLRELNIIPGKYALEGAYKSDNIRVRTAEKRTSMMTLEVRRAKRMLQKHKNEQLLIKEGITYQAGSF